MKKTAVVAVALAVLAGPAHAAGLEALKAAPAFPAAAVLKNQPPAPELGGQAAVHGHEAAGYATQFAARSALNTLRDRLAQSGITVLGARVVPGAAGKFGFHLDYLDSQERPGNPGREIESYASPEFATAFESNTELNRSVASLNAAGYAILRSQAAGQAGKFTYSVDYIRGPQVARANFYFFTSPVYAYALRGIAARDMQLTIFNLQARGYRILSYNLYQVPGTFLVQYHIRYFGR